MTQHELYFEHLQRLNYNFPKMSDNFQILLNNEQVYEITRDLFKKFPKDSLLYNLLKDDQPMATKHANGQYVLTLNYPEYFEHALTCFETQ